MIIACDFDGTITTENNFPNIAPLRPYVAQAIENLRKAGHKVILWTCREGRYLDEAVIFLANHGIMMDGYNYNPFYQLQSRKIAADIYIDDKNVLNVNDVDWKKIEEYILSLGNKETEIKKY